MENYRNQYNEVLDNQTGDKTMVKSFMSSVFSYMFLGLALTGFTAWYFAENNLITQYLVNENGGASIFMWIAMFAPLGFVFLMSFGYKRLSAGLMLLLFVAFAVINGISFSTIFIVYPMGSIYLAFASASSIFAVMAIVGYTTDTDLTKLGNILYIGLIGIIIASVINFFVGSGLMDYVISIIGVAIFTGLTAYDTQKLKQIGESSEIGLASTKKRAVFGALSLYLDFINLFLFLLRLLGGRD